MSHLQVLVSLDKDQKQPKMANMQRVNNLEEYQASIDAAGGEPVVVEFWSDDFPKIEAWQ